MWSGSAFPGQCELVLSHNQFTERRFCPDMSIIANPLSVIDTCFTSQLTVNNVNTDLNGMNIICQHDTAGSVTIGNYTIILTTGKVRDKILHFSLFIEILFSFKIRSLSSTR